jgi:hypothetical protein
MKATIAIFLRGTVISFCVTKLVKFYENGEISPCVSQSVYSFCVSPFVSPAISPFSLSLSHSVPLCLASFFIFLFVTLPAVYYNFLSPFDSSLSKVQSLCNPYSVSSPLSLLLCLSVCLSLSVASPLSPLGLHSLCTSVAFTLSHPTICSSNHPLIKPANRPTIYTSKRSLIKPYTHSIIHSSNHSLIQPFIHPTIHSSNHSFIQPFTHLTIHSSKKSSNHSFIQLFIHPCIQ